MVRARHDEIQKIERDFVELAQLFTDLDTLVVQQEDPVNQIETKGQEVHDDMKQGNEQMNTAIDKAYSRRRKKWWCLLISSEYSPMFGVMVVLSLISSQLSLLLSLLSLLRLWS